MMRYTAILASFLAAIACSTIAPVMAEDAYWITNGYTGDSTCDGFTDGVDIKGGTTKADDGGWLPIARVNGLFSCTDDGDVYRLRIKFISVEIEEARRASLPARLHFTWLGLALYRPTNSGSDIDWLYDEAFPVDGYLDRDATEPIFFGNIEFTYDKELAKQASFVTLYLTFNNTMSVFGLSE